ncbi:MAG TPA: hypothetical protein VIS06_00055 [Mycobacteriales bacterium]|jgi:hypothetical protein
MGLFHRSTNTTAADDTLRYLKGRRGALLADADERRLEAREARSATGRARLLGQADAMQREARQLGREIRRSS